MSWVGGGGENGQVVRIMSTSRLGEFSDSGSNLRLRVGLKYDGGKLVAHGFSASSMR
jgi:hypothetical protein